MCILAVYLAAVLINLSIAQADMFGNYLISIENYSIVCY